MLQLNIMCLYLLSVTKIIYYGNNCWHKNSVLFVCNYNNIIKSKYSKIKNCHLINSSQVLLFIDYDSCLKEK